MKTVSVTNSYITRLAGNSAYNWMRSLAPIRRIQQKRGKAKGCSSCARKALRGAKLGTSTYQEISASPQFVRELQRLKHSLKADKMIVSVGNLRTTL